MIYLKNVTKNYKNYSGANNTLKSLFLSLGRPKKNSDVCKVISPIFNLNLHVKSAEVLGIVGRNGAGKSTLAKLIAGTIQPTSGSITVHGRVVPFLELGVAFNPELTGLDNMYLNGVMLGLRLDYLRAHKQSIFEYADVVQFMDTPLKYYSTGMQLRLAFSIAMHSKGDIYIFDEILSVGDADFQKKCFDSFEMLLAQKKTIIMIGHDVALIEKYAHRVLCLSDSEPEIKIIDRDESLY